MPIFRYTFKKILISPSTWVIFALTLIVLGLAWGLPVALLNNQGIKIDWTKELILSFFLAPWKVLAFTAFIGLMLLIFIGVKSTQIFRDEIDDGTLLILVSKPISRNRIWAEKWLAFQATVISYTFFSILLGGLLLAIPGIGGSVVYLTLLPYMGILFGIALLFDLIFTSVVLLLSLVLNSKATIALTVGFAALTNIFSQAIDPLVSIPATYFQYSHAVAVYHDLQNKLSADDFNWCKEQENNPTYITDISNMMKKVYKTSIQGVDYPTQYNPIKEQEVLHAIIANPTAHPEYSQDEVTLISHIVHVSNIFRQWKEQSYEELMTSNAVGQNHQMHGFANPGTNGVNYNVIDVVIPLKTPINKEALDTFNSRILQKKVMRYFNIFYQLYYLWNGAWGGSDSLYISDTDYQKLDDPYLVSFNNKDTTDSYQVDVNSGTSRILNFPVLVTFYIIVGTSLLGASWYVFNRRDFA